MKIFKSSAFATLMEATMSDELLAQVQEVKETFYCGTSQALSFLRYRTEGQKLARSVGQNALKYNNTLALPDARDLLGLGLLVRDAVHNYFRVKEDRFHLTDNPPKDDDEWSYFRSVHNNAENRTKSWFRENFPAFAHIYYEWDFISRADPEKIADMRNLSAKTGLSVNACNQAATFCSTLDDFFMMDENSRNYVFTMFASQKENDTSSRAITLCYNYFFGGFETYKRLEQDQLLRHHDYQRGLITSVLRCSPMLYGVSSVDEVVDRAKNWSAHLLQCHKGPEIEEAVEFWEYMIVTFERHGSFVQGFLRERTEPFF